MSLTNIQIKAMKPGGKMLYDELGLSIYFPPMGAKGRILKRRWRFKYSFEGKGKSISLGQYPDVSLKEARRKRGEARELLRKGIDPSARRKAKKRARLIERSNSFESVGREWFEMKRSNWASNYAPSIMRRLEAHIFPKIGSRPIIDITAPELLDVIRAVENRGTVETARRTFSYCGQIFRYAIATGRAERDITYRLVEALKVPQKKHLAAITEPVAVADLLCKIDAYSGSPVVCAALRFSPLVFQRPGEIRKARWDQIDFEAAEWRFKASKMRGSAARDHIVPLSRQALAVLWELRPYTGKSEYVFPGGRSPRRPMSENALRIAFKTMELELDMTAHGFRAMARTMLDEQLGENIAHIEQQLAHSVRDPLGRAYNRTAHLEQRRKMMQRWADYLDELRGV